MNTHSTILGLIKQGESQHLDFKFEISDSKKIARILSAFSNTDGGKLLIGVKDNGNIVGVRSSEELHMIEAAAQMYCKPEIRFTAKEWEIKGKTVLEITIPKRSSGIPVKAPNQNGKWMVYVRVNDQNILANQVLLKVWKRQKKKTPIQITFTDTEKTLLDYLNANKAITLSHFSKIALISRNKAQAILVDFILLNIIKMELSEKQCLYTLTKNHTKSDTRL